MDEGSAETNWLAIAISGVCLAGFVSSFYIAPKRIDVQWIMTKYALRWEMPVAAALFLVFNYHPADEVLYAGVAAFFIVSGIATWFAYRETKALERQGKLAKSDGTTDRTRDQRDP